MVKSGSAQHGFQHSFIRLQPSSCVREHLFLLCGFLFAVGRRQVPFTFPAVLVNVSCGQKPLFIQELRRPSFQATHRVKVWSLLGASTFRFERLNHDTQPRLELEGELAGASASEGRIQLSETRIQGPYNKSAVRVAQVAWVKSYH